MYNPNQINNISEIKQPYSFSDIECLYHTGRSIYISGSGRNKVTTYRSGVATNIGDIVSDVWIEAMEHLIKESNEESIYHALKEYCKDTCAWLHTEKELHMYTLELHSSRIFENKDWVGYTDFKTKYMKELEG